MAAELATSLAPTEADRLMQAEALVRGYCDWHIAPSRTETLTVVGSGSAALLLPSMHVASVASVMDDGTLVSPDDYYCSPAGVLTRWAGVWGTRLVVIQLDHGYPEVPAEVTAVVQAIAQRAVNNPGSLVRTQEGPFSDTYSQTGSNQSLPMALMDAEKAILDRYRIPARP